MSIGLRDPLSNFLLEIPREADDFLGQWKRPSNRNRTFNCRGDFHCGISTSRSTILISLIYCKKSTNNRLLKPYGKVGTCKTDRQLLWDYWARPKNWFIYQPIHIVRQYFGEKLAFYFSWLGFYTTWLVLPSIVGFLVFIYGAITVIWDKPT